MNIDAIMKQFQIYLRSELGKLKNQGDAEVFLRSVDPNVLGSCGLQTDVADLRKRFESQQGVDDFVRALKPQQLEALTATCDRDWRRNGVFDVLSGHNPWMTSSVRVDLVDVQQAEPQLRYIFERNGFRLTAIAADSQLWANKPYADWDRAGTVHFSTVLGRRKADRHKLFDGVHRSILLCSQGSRSLDICFYDA